MENKLSKIILNGDNVIGYVYQSLKYGRTLVLTGSMDLTFPIKIYDREISECEKETDVIEFFQSMLLTN